uniref:Uncharacterized protein n=1 Tax=Anguilla anguilla TaxID=7936 RepID=A0A0E9ULI7_ANGAN
MSLNDHFHQALSLFDGLFSSSVTAGFSSSGQKSLLFHHI